MRDSIRHSAKLCAALALTFLMAASASFNVLAAGRVETNQETQLNLEYTYDGKGLPGAQFEIYRVADITEGGEYVLSGDFAEYPVSLKELDAEGWRRAAHTLSVYATADKRGPARAGTTDETGGLAFDNLSTGLYLVRAEELLLDGRTYRSEDFLVSLPSLENNEWNYQASARPKIIYDGGGTTPDGPSGGGDTPPSGKTKLTVIKVWNDGDNRGERPSKIRVKLLRDGESQGEVTLSASNHWRHTWSGLNGEYTWEAVESGVPSAYTVTYSEEDTVYTITNSATVEIDDGDVPRGGMDMDTIEDGPVPLAMLPQTGLLWWPVPFLSMLGLLLFGLGYKDYLKGKRENRQKYTGERNTGRNGN